MNSLIFLGAEIKYFFPYLYAFCIDKEELDENEYDAFIYWLRAFLEKIGVFGRDICEEAFEFYSSYFRDKGETFELKMALCYYIVRNYIDGRNKEFDFEFEKVRQYKLSMQS